MNSAIVNKTILLICAMFLSINFSLAQSKQFIEDIEIRGYKLVPLAALKKKIKSRGGDKFDNAQAQRDFTALVNTGCFDKLRSRLVVIDGPKAGKVIIFELKETPDTCQLLGKTKLRK